MLLLFGVVFILGIRGSLIEELRIAIEGMLGIVYTMRLMLGVRDDDDCLYSLLRRDGRCF